MSQEQLVSAYLDGGMSRRVFVRRLAATGISLGAAISYAHMLSPERSEAAGARASSDFYTPAGIDVQVRSKNLDKVLDKGKLKLFVSSDEAATVQLSATVKEKGKALVIASGAVAFAAAGAQLVKLNLSADGKKALKDRESAKVTVNASAQDQQLQTSFDLVSRKLK